MKTPENNAGAPQPGRYTAEQLRVIAALEDLDSLWGDEYDLWTREGRYLGQRVDGTGQTLTADTPEELDAAIRSDRAAR